MNSTRVLWGFNSIFICKVLLLGILFVSINGELSAQVTGKVYRDYNSDGIQQSGEPGRGGIIVNFYKVPASR